MLRWVSALGRRVALRAFTLVHALATSARLPGPVLRCALTAAALVAPEAGLWVALALLVVAGPFLKRMRMVEQDVSQAASVSIFEIQSKLGE